MMQNIFYEDAFAIKKKILFFVLMVAIVAGWIIASNGLAISIVLLLFPCIIVFGIMVLVNPRIGFISTIIYPFIIDTIGKHIDGLQVGLGVEALLVLTWVGVLFNNTGRYKLRYLNTDLVWTFIIWFLITFIELFNPEKPDAMGWLLEMRAIALYQILCIPLGLLLFNKKKDLDLFIAILLSLSSVVALYGIKQFFIGPDAAEMRWLEAGGKVTHIIFGKLRIFSMYSEAAQFGAAMANVAIISLILALGQGDLFKKLLYISISVLTFYAMVISGTRTAIFVFICGGMVYLILSKNIRILIAGSITGLAFIGILKFTSIGNGYSDISRLRTSFDPTDPSFLTRLNNQLILKEILSTKPIGAGVGVIGAFGMLYNADKYISTIQPDSLFVKIWAMYGIVGLSIWMGIMTYLIGKSIGIIWSTRDPILKNKLTALAAGAAGIFLCSYGNEIINQMPSLMIVYVSWVLIWLSPRWDSINLKPNNL